MLLRKEELQCYPAFLGRSELLNANIAIMRAFVKMRHALLAHQGIARRVEKLEGKIDMHETDIRLLVQDVDKFKETSGAGWTD